MISDSKSYSLFLKFIETYFPVGFRGIDRNDPLMIELEEWTERTNQFFFVGDILQMKIYYTSNRSIQMIGIAPEEVTPYHFREGVHPDDAQRHGLGTAQLFKIANELFIKRNGTELLSTNLRIRNPIGYYSDLLIQCYLFYSDSPIKTVYLLQIHTDIEGHKKIKNGYHYYVGNDRSYFRYPDEELLKIGNSLTNREFEIVKLIAAGLSSEQIAAHLFLSVHTINTHRGNILSKTGFLTISELIFDFMNHGML
jgi:DNA-binding CsgD family transcriptional regulator